MPSTADDEDQACGQREALAEVERNRLPDLLPLDAEEVDANHRSPTRRSARPTATAAVERHVRGSPDSFFASQVIA